MLKSFQSNGHNLITNTITGVDFVVQDEVMHGNFAAYLFKTVLYEDSKYTKQIDTEQLTEDIDDLINEVISHEDAVIDYIFSGVDSINDVTPEQLKLFIRSRSNEVLNLLNLHGCERFIVETNPVAEWFYQGANSIKMHDFFVSGTNQYRRSWQLDSFSRIPHMQGATDE
jgi:ribonucleotide reductase beta subunit family protein with ferritin-like domain